MTPDKKKKPSEAKSLVPDDLKTAVDYFEANKHSLAPLTSHVITFFKHLKNGHFDKARELLKDVAALAEAKAGRKDVDAAIVERESTLAKGTELLGLFIKLAGLALPVPKL